MKIEEIAIIIFVAVCFLLMFSLLSRTIHYVHILHSNTEDAWGYYLTFPATICLFALLIMLWFVRKRN